MQHPQMRVVIELPSNASCPEFLREPRFERQPGRSPRVEHAVRQAMKLGASEQALSVEPRRHRGKRAQGGDEIVISR
ncbi:hypothetical protein AKJ09_07469 [Labilithrix luteola]|uniref:Uncharacterized protein n=1 Tax=Labilithrix luteola TaxID=1391654 RepID=A0A0K1Q4Q3_9BACT|nr:hypothetical protein AKJ09_07469 [Labilithrix luteola]